MTPEAIHGKLQATNVLKVEQILTQPAINQKERKGQLDDDESNPSALKAQKRPKSLA